MSDATARAHPIALRADDGRDRRAVAQYCDLMSVWPTGVAVVTGTDATGRRHGMTCNSLCSVSLAPPSLLVSLHVSTGTATAIRDSGVFCVNFLQAGRDDVSQAFASRNPDRFQDITWQESRFVRQPWLVDAAFALLECRLSSITTVHDHFLMVGDVLGVQRSARDALLYHDRKYGSVRI